MCVYSLESACSSAQFDLRRILNPLPFPAQPLLHHHRPNNMVPLVSRPRALLPKSILQMRSIFYSHSTASRAVAIPQVPPRPHRRTFLTPLTSSLAFFNTNNSIPSSNSIPNSNSLGDLIDSSSLYVLFALLVQLYVAQQVSIYVTLRNLSTIPNTSVCNGWYSWRYYINRTCLLN
jgi:hypothetical protein